MPEKKFSIDFVFPYVTSNDPEWQANFNYWSAQPKSYEVGARFRDFSVLKYIFRSIQVFAPFIDRVFVLVASEKQVPTFLNKECPKLKIVTHDQFIPKRYLPTFNSNTIEMFLPFIPDLGEHFIYSNDDLIFHRPTDWTDFYTSDGKAKLAYQYSKDPRPTYFRFCCRQTWKAVANLYPKVKIDNQDYTFIKQFHGAASPRLLSDCKECFEKLEKDILKSLTVTRNYSCNLNQYLFGYYSMFKDHYEKIPEKYIGTYIDLGTKSLKETLNMLSNVESKMICINDTDKMCFTDIEEIRRTLEIELSEKSIFEI